MDIYKATYVINSSKIIIESFQCEEKEVDIECRKRFGKDFDFRKLYITKSNDEFSKTIGRV